MEYGTEAQKETYLIPLVRGEFRSCIAMTEPEYPGSPTWMETTAVEDGDYYINRHKWFTSATDGAAFAIVMAVTNPEAENRYQWNCYNVMRNEVSETSATFFSTMSLGCSVERLSSHRFTFDTTAARPKTNSSLPLAH